MAWDDSATRWAVCWAQLAVLLTTPPPPPSTHELWFILQVATALDFPPGRSHSHHGSGLPAWVTLTPRSRTSCLGGHTHTTAPDFPPWRSHSHHGPGLPTWGVTLTPRPRTSRLGGHTHTMALDFPPGRSHSHHGSGLPAWEVTLTPRPRTSRLEGHAHTTALSGAPAGLASPTQGRGWGATELTPAGAGFTEHRGAPRALPATGSEQTRWCVASQTRSVGAPRGLEEESSGG